MVLAGALAVVLAAITLAFSSKATAGGIIKSGSTPTVSKVSTAKVVGETVADPASAEEFWTPERLAAAKPVDMPTPDTTSLDIPDFGGGDASASAATGDFTPGNVTSFPQVVHGKIFFKVGASTYSCSGTIVDSKNRNVVYTAGHCVYDRESATFATELVFIPGYENGVAPLGVGSATQMYTTQQWVQQGANAYDIAVVVLDQPAQNFFGARKGACDLGDVLDSMKGLEYTIFGYPSKPSPRFNGEVLQGCHSAFNSFDSTQGLKPFPMAANPCFMQQGASGGGWITLGNYINSVVSYGYCDNIPETCGTIFGPYFSNAAKSLYVQAGGSPAPTVKLLSGPPKKVRKRAVSFRFGGTAATLLSFSCKLDRQKPVPCSSKISIRRLSPGKHTLRVRAVDQTGKQSKKQIVRTWRVKLRR